MALNHSLICGAFLVVVTQGCEVSSGNCSPDSMVSCTGTSIGYSCKGGDTPAATDESLNCSMGVAGTAGATLYCCQTITIGALDAGGGATMDAGSISVVPDAAMPDAGVFETAGGDTAVADTAAVDAAASDAASADAAVADAGMCPVSPKTSSAACDQCLGSLCCPSLVPCSTPDNAGVDDAGMSACEQLLGCIRDCIAGNPDAGVAPGTRSDCQMVCGPSYTSTEQQSASAVLDCQTSSCSPPCQ